MIEFEKNKFELDKIIAIIGIILSIVFMLFIIQKNMSKIYTVISVLSGFCFLLWIGIRNNATIKLTHLPNTDNKSYISIFIILYTLSILSIYMYTRLYERPYIYFIITSLLISTVFFQIIMQNSSKYIIPILFQIILIGISLAWSQTLIYPDLVGLDPWFHRYFTTTIIEKGIIPQGYSYSKIPLFHILIAITSIITSQNYKFSVMLAPSIMQIICNILFIYLIGYYVTKNYKIGLLSSLLLTSSNFHIFMSYWSIPNAFAFTYIPAIIYISMKIKPKHQIITAILIMILSFALVLSHTITTMFMFIVIVMFLISYLIFDLLENKISLNNLNRNFYSFMPFTFSYLLLFFALMFAWWIYQSNDITRLANLIESGFSKEVFFSTPYEALKYQIHTTFYEKLFNNIGMFVYYSLSFIGFLYMISNKYRTSLSFSFALVAITPLVLGFTSMISGHSIIEQRWWYFAEVLLSIPLSIAIVLLFNEIKGYLFKRVIFWTFMFLLSIFLIISPAATVDHPFPTTGFRNAFTESELNALNRMGDTYNGIILTDQFFYLTQRYEYNVGSFDSYLLKNEKEINNRNVFLLRGDTIGKIFMGFDTLIKMNELEISNRLFISNSSKIYNNGYSFAYTSK